MSKKALLQGFRHERGLSGRSALPLNPLRKVPLINADHDIRCLDDCIDCFSFFQFESIG